MKKLTIFFVCLLFLISILIIPTNSMNTNNQEGPYIDLAKFELHEDVFSKAALENSWSGAESSYSGIFFSTPCLLSDGSIIAQVPVTYQGTGDYSVNDRYITWSYDDGETWTEPVPFYDGHYLYGDDIKSGGPFVIDKNNRLWCIITVDFHSSSHIFAVYSDDKGHTWTGISQDDKFINSEAIDITAKANLDELSHPRNGNFISGCLTNNGRLVFVSWVNGHGQNSNLFSLWTDNSHRGLDSTWYHSEEFGLDTEYSETGIVYLQDGSIYATIRDNAKEGGTPRRFASRCNNAGYGTMTWSEPVATELYDPESKGVIQRWTTKKDSDKNRVVLCWNNNQYSRNDLTLGVSYDECQSWEYKRVINDYEYPDLVVTEEKTLIGSYVVSRSQSTIDLFECNIEWVTNGWDTLSDELVANAGGPYYGQINELINFYGQAYRGNPPYTFEWDFDASDGIQVDSTMQNPSHIYSETKQYMVTLTVRDSKGDTDTDTTIVSISPPNQKPAKPEIIKGPSYGKTNIEYAYEVKTTDPDFDKVYYLWDWGDVTSDWLGPYESGEICETSNSWNEKGSYIVKVKAKDIYELESDWSEPLNVEMPRINSFSIIEKFQTLFPNLFLIIQKILLK